MYSIFIIGIYRFKYNYLTLKSLIRDELIKCVMYVCMYVCMNAHYPGGGGGGGYLTDAQLGRCGRVAQFLTLFKTQISN